MRSHDEYDYDYDVFISYASEDVAIVKRVVDCLKAADVDVWWDQEQIRWGDRTFKMIREGLRQSKRVIAVVSEHSVEKSWPQRELDIALHQAVERDRNAVLPVLICAPGAERELLKRSSLPGDIRYIRWSGDPAKVASQYSSSVTKHPELVKPPPPSPVPREYRHAQMSDAPIPSVIQLTPQPQLTRASKTLLVGAAIGVGILLLVVAMVACHALEEPMDLNHSTIHQMHDHNEMIEDLRRCHNGGRTRHCLRIAQDDLCIGGGCKCQHHLRACRLEVRYCQKIPARVMTCSASVMPRISMLATPWQHDIGRAARG